MSETYHHGRLRTALIEEARRTLEEGDGLPGLREVARRVGVSPTATYRHFASREALLTALAAQGFEDLNERFADAAANAAGSALIAVGHAYVAFARARPAMFRLMFGGAIPLTGAEGDRVGSDAYGTLLSSVARSMGRSAEDPAVLREAVRAWSLVHGYAMLLLDDRLPDAAQSDAFLADFLRGNS